MPISEQHKRLFNRIWEAHFQRVMDTTVADFIIDNFGEANFVTVAKALAAEELTYYQQQATFYDDLVAQMEALLAG